MLMETAWVVRSSSKSEKRKHQLKGEELPFSCICVGFFDNLEKKFQQIPMF